MNILYIALLVCMVRHVFASGSDALDVDKQVVPSEDVDEEEDIATNPNVQEFMKAAQKGDMRTAHTAFKSCDSDKLKEYCGEHLVNLGMSKLFELAKGAVYKSWMLKVILVYASRKLFDEVSAKTDPTNSDLRDVAKRADLASNAEELFYLLGKLTGKIQEWAVEGVVVALVKANKLEIFDHMLSALESKPSLNPGMANIAIRQAFETASFYKDGRVLVARYFDHPAILAKEFPCALDRFYAFEDPEHAIFYNLLAQADRQDLEEVRGKVWFSMRPSEFRNAVNKALEAVGTEARIGIRRRRIEPFLMDLLPKDLFDIIFGYYLDDSTIF